MRIIDVGVSTVIAPSAVRVMMTTRGRSCICDWNYVVESVSNLNHMDCALVLSYKEKFYYESNVTAKAFVKPSCCAIAIRFSLAFLHLMTRINSAQPKITIR